MKLFTVMMLLIALAVVGCGVNKDYVSQQIEESEARTSSEISTLRDKTDGNASEITKLRSLATQIDEKADLAIDKAKGFENYQVLWSGEINFDFDSHMINGAAEQILMEAGDKMDLNPGSLIEIAGHTDKTGSNNYNLMLGQQRATSAKRFLSEKFGISLYRMFEISYGEEKAASGSGEMSSSSKNRRVNLKIWGPVQ